MADRSRFEVHGPRLTVVLTLAVALLSLATGIANIGTNQVFGPLAAYIPTEIQRLAGFTGAFTGFLMIASALGLRRRLRVAWYSAVVLLPLTAVQGLVQSSQLSLPLVVLSILALPNLLVHRRQFDRELDLSTTQVSAIAALVGAQIYGTVGTYALRDSFGQVSTLVDAFYYTLVTASTVGYGEITPQGQFARLFAMSVIVVGTASFAFALGSLLGPAIEARLSKALGRMTQAQLDILEDHVLVLGYGDLTEPILESLDDGDVAFVVVTPDEARAAELAATDYQVLTGDPSDDEQLERAGIDSARAVVVATNDDGEDALAVLTARQLNPDISIVAAATNRDNVEKLRRAGADAVISPANLGGRLLVQSALGRVDVEELAHRVLSEAEDAE